MRTGGRSGAAPRVLNRIGEPMNGERIPRGKPWDRQPISGKLRRKFAVSPGVCGVSPPNSAMTSVLQSVPVSEQRIGGALSDGLRPGEGELPGRFVIAE
jgi:hypothetical protein